MVLVPYVTLLVIFKWFMIKFEKKRFSVLPNVCSKSSFFLEGFSSGFL